MQFLWILFLITYFFIDLLSECLPIMREIRRTGKLCDIVIKVSNFAAQQSWKHFL